MRSKMATAMSGSRLYVFGGLGAGPVSEMWVFDLKAMRWNPIRPDGPCPPARCGHSFTTDSEGHLWLFGGQAGSKEKVDIKKEGTSSMRVRMLDRRNVFSDSWVFDPNAGGGKGAWEEQRITGISPSPRRGHSATMVTVHKRSSKHRDMSATSTGGGGGDDNLSLSSGAPPPEQEMKSKRRSSGGNGRDQELYVIGGAGPDPGKGFETVHAQLWIFNLKRRDWCQADCKGLPPDSWARFEHTATLVPGGMQGVGAGDTLVVVGGVSASTVDTSHLLNQGGGEGVDGAGVPAGPGGASYSWGGPESRILALAVDTLVWTQLITAVPSSNLLSSFSSQLSEEPIFPAPSLHGHATIANPYDPRELLVFGGRGEKAWSNELYSLVLPPPHTPGTPYPGMPKKKWGKKLNSSSPTAGMSQTQGATTKLMDEDDPSAIPEPLAGWASLGSLCGNDTHLPARYGHCLSTWLPAAFIKERERLRGDGEGGRASRSGRSRKTSSRQQENSTTGENGLKVANADMGPDLSPKFPGLVMFGGSLSGSNSLDPSEGSGYANSDVFFLSLEGLQSSGDLRKLAKSRESSDQSKTLVGSLDGSIQRSVHHSQESQLSQSQVILAKLLEETGGEEGNGDSLPAGYSEMKQLLLGQREDHRTSKLKRGDHARTEPTSFGATSPVGGGLGTTMLGTTASSGILNRTMNGGGSGGGGGPTPAHSATMSAARNNVSSPLSTANSTMAYMKLRRLADHDVRFEPTPLDLGRSALMKEILSEAVFPPLNIPSSSENGRGTLTNQIPPPSRYRRPQTAEELFERKINKEKLKHKTPKEKFQEKWAVPGLYELVNPKPRAIITVTEARRRFRAVTEDPTATGGR